MHKLTQYSHGAGCGCKIAPAILDELLKSSSPIPVNDKLIVGNTTKDDAAVYDLGNGKGLISTTDFFMPIVDNAFDFGRIASANAISDVYAMGGQPIMALAILGWPVDKLPISLAQQVIEGARNICNQVNIPLAGGHSIDSLEPIFGLSVSGLIELKNLKRNNTAKAGDLIYLTKPLGTGIFTTAEKKGQLKEEHIGVATKYMTQLNSIGIKLGELSGVSAMTDVTGFGLLGHLVEMAEGSELQAELWYDKVPLIKGTDHYIKSFCFPDNTYRNWNGYEQNVNGITADSLVTLCDPQTNGGLLIAVRPSDKHNVESLLMSEGLDNFTQPIGFFKKAETGKKRIEIQ